MMKSLRVLSVVAATAAVLIGGAARAESQYGYSSAGAAPALTATAKLNVTVTVPKLILLRVGLDSTAISTAAMTATLLGGIPGGLGVLANGSNLASPWDGTAPAWNNATATAIRAYAWTNASGGGSVTPAVTTDFADLTLKTKIAIASTLVSGGGLTHPATMNLTTAIPFAKNAVASSDWVFSITAAFLGTSDAGAQSAQMTYTATTL